MLLRFAQQRLPKVTSPPQPPPEHQNGGKGSDDGEADAKVDKHGARGRLRWRES